MTSRVALLLLLLATAGCAGEREARQAALARLPPLPHSSIAAVLEHRGELELTEEQVARLGQVDVELQQAVNRLRQEGGLPPPAPQAGPGPGLGGRPGSTPGAPGEGRPGGGTPGGDRGPGGGGPSERGAGASGRNRPGPARLQAALDASLDDADTRAFLKAEEVLGPRQRERAREIAAAYREQRFDRREAERAR